MAYSISSAIMSELERGWSLWTGFTVTVKMEDTIPDILIYIGFVRF